MATLDPSGSRAYCTGQRSSPGCSVRRPMFSFAPQINIVMMSVMFPTVIYSRPCGLGNLRERISSNN